MNKKDLLLGDYFENGRMSSRQPVPRRSPTSDALESFLGSLYEELAQRIHEADLDIELDTDITDAEEKLKCIGSVIQHLLELRESGEDKQQKECENCMNYEKQLQKVEADVRQHIRLEQQLKLYQDSIEEKNEETKKENKVLEKELETLKKKVDEYKLSTAPLQDKLAKYEVENEQLRAEIKNLKSTLKALAQKQDDHQQQQQQRKHLARKDENQMAHPQFGRSTNHIESVEKRENNQNHTNFRPSHHQNNTKFDSKTNLAEKYPLTRTINFSSNGEERKSIDKKLVMVESKLDAEKYRQSMNNKSTNLIRPPTDRKRYDEKPVLNKENKRPATGTKIDYRR